jgi:hypothetical protein
MQREENPFVEGLRAWRCASFHLASALIARARQKVSYQVEALRSHNRARKAFGGGLSPRRVALFVWRAPSQEPAKIFWWRGFSPLSMNKTAFGLVKK